MHPFSQSRRSLVSLTSGLASPVHNGHVDSKQSEHAPALSSTPRPGTSADDEDQDEDWGNTNSSGARLAPSSSSSDLRHGFGSSVVINNSKTHSAIEAIVNDSFFYWTEARPSDEPYLPSPSNPPDWRNRDKAKTAAAALLLCLRLGIEPPDVVRPNPCATMECWVETAVVDKDKALAEVGMNLEKQYSSLANSKVKYKQYLDPKQDETRRLAIHLRKVAKQERALFHYNGHGVPKPTPSGEIWVFNKDYTQYIPITLNDLLGWVGAPTIFVWDCSSAGNIVAKICECADKKDADSQAKLDAAAKARTPSSSSSHHPHQQHPQQPPFESNSSAPGPAEPEIQPVSYKDTIQLAACAAHQTLPMHPDLPADLFTSCLTSPIETALRFFILRNPLRADLDLSLAFKIPGKLSERKSPLGELLWIFTAVTDTIAWNTLPPATFQRLFRHDLVVAALFRGFLLAERIMRYYDCTPISVPALPHTHNHPMWDSWDLAVDRCLAQLPAILQREHLRQQALDNKVPPQNLPPELPFASSRFFSDQLAAFEVWLEHGFAREPPPTNDKGELITATADGRVSHKAHPEQLAIVLQVLLAQAHRLRALISLCKFLDLGPWAVHLSLTIGIFPYVLRLLQAPSVDHKPVLIYIWGRILGVYRSCQEDLIKSSAPVSTLQASRAPESPYLYFVRVLMPNRSKQSPLPVVNISEHQAMCSFILSVVCRDFVPGKIACMQPNAPVMESCLAHLENSDPLLRQWSALCLAQLWDDFDEAKAKALQLSAHQKLMEMLIDDLPEVRASVLYALGTLLGTTGSADLHKKPEHGLGDALADQLQMSESTIQDTIFGLAMSVLKLLGDGAPVVRRELVVVLSAIVAEQPGHCVLAAYEVAKEERGRRGHGYSPEQKRAELVDQIQQLSPDGAGAPDSLTGIPSFSSTVFKCIYKVLLDLASDPYPKVAEVAGDVLDFIHARLMQSKLLDVDPLLKDMAASVPQEPSKPPVEQQQPAKNTVTRSLSGAAPKRSSSVAQALSRLAHLSFTEPPSPADSTQSSEPGRVSRTEAASPDLQTRRPFRATDSSDSVSETFNSRYNPKTVEEAAKVLLEGDEEKHRRRRSRPTTPTSETTSMQGDASTSVTPADEASQSGIPEMPLRSDFYDYASRWFREPQLKASEAEEPGSVTHTWRRWRQERAKQALKTTMPLRPWAGESRWDEQIAFLSTESSTTAFAFHPFDDHLVCADESGTVSCWEWRKNRRVSKFKLDSQSRKTGRISSLKFVNETDKSLLMAGSSDGCVRIFKDYESSKDCNLLTAFRGLSDFVPSTRQEAGLVLEWQSTRGILIAGGNTKHLRLWDAAKDSSIAEIPTRSNSCVSSLSSDQLGGDIIAAGFGDGVVRVYDRRAPSRDQMVRVYKGHHEGWVQNVRMQAGGTRELMTGSLAGDIAFWDIRSKEPIKKVQAHQGEMFACDLHDQAPVFATGGDHQVIKLWNPAKPEPISRFRNGAGYLPQRNPNSRITNMVFHPVQMALGVASGDGNISVYRCAKELPKYDF